MTYKLFVSLIGLTDPVLIRLDVDSKLSEQLKVGYYVVSTDFPKLTFFCVQQTLLLLNLCFSC